MKCEDPKLYQTPSPAQRTRTPQAQDGARLLQVQHLLQSNPGAESLGRLTNQPTTYTRPLTLSFGSLFPHQLCSESQISANFPSIYTHLAEQKQIRASGRLRIAGTSPRWKEAGDRGSELQMERNLEKTSAKLDKTEK